MKTENSNGAEADEPKNKKSRAATKIVKEDSDVEGEEAKEANPKKSKASVRRVKTEQDSEAQNTIQTHPKRSWRAPAKLKKEMIDDVEETDVMPPPRRTRAPHRKGVAAVERPTSNEDGRASESEHEAKAEKSDESGSAFESVDKPKTTNGHVRKGSRGIAAKDPPKKVKAATSAKQVRRPSPWNSTS